ncbi:MAG: hypothetical protein SH857_11315 [Chitinophagales bacterium]|nr:hypothetical protein [Chitinophagales bacterium]
MRHLFSFFFFLLLQTGFHLSAQTETEVKPETKAETKAETKTDPAVAKPLVIEDITKNMSKGMQPGFKIDVHNATKKGITEAVSKVMKEENKSKVVLVNNEYSIMGNIIKSISSKPLNVYIILNEYEDRVEMLTFYEMDSVFLTKEKNESEYIAARKFTRDYAMRAYQNAVQEKIDAEKDKLKDLQSELDKIHKENDNLQKKISEEKQTIDNTKEKISTCELDQERVRKQVQEQKAAVALAKSGGNEVLLKEEEKKLKSLEGELSKLQKNEDGCHKDITGSEADIRDYERDISNNENAAIIKQGDRDKQQELINNLNKKLASIQ